MSDCEELNKNTIINTEEGIVERKKKGNRDPNIEIGHSNSHSNSTDSDVKINIETIINSSMRLFKTNEEFYYLAIFTFIWLGLMMFEFIYGFLESKVDIVSDSFFNYFKTFSFLITGFSILLSRVFVFNKIFLKNRIELIAALSNCVFLVIISMYMCLQALHLVTESNEHDEEQDESVVKFLKNFFVVKAILNVIALMIFSDYILHPSIQIKLLMWKRYRNWKELNTLDIDNLKESKNLIKQWNNHFENMNALTINIITDLISSILFIICFYVSKDQHFEFTYSLISIVNLFVIFVLVGPVFKSTLKVLMQGKSDIYECFYNKMQKEISYFEGCSGIKEMKFWMVSQSEIKCILCIFINRLY